MNYQKNNVPNSQEQYLELPTFYKKLSFWSLQFYGWTMMFFIVLYKMSALFPNLSLELAIMYSGIACSSGVILTSLNRLFYKKINIIEKPFNSILLISFPVAVISGSFAAYFHAFIVPKFLDGLPVINDISQVMVNHIIIYCFWNTIYFMLKLLQLSIIVNKKRTLITEKMKSEQLKTLRFQLKPHFLFNVLNSLHYLIKESPDKARNMTMHLAKYFQHILSEESSETIPLINELNLIKEYFEVQKIRFEEMLSTSVSCPENLLTVEIPRMIIFPLIENAVKYGYSTHSGNYSIDLCVQEEEKNLIISVENDGQWVKEKEENKNDEFVEYEGGIGLQNIRKRLNLHYKEKWSLNHTEKDGKVIVTLRLPL